MVESIKIFLEERKALWLKERLKKAEDESAIAELQQQAAERYSLKEWLPEAAKRVIQLSMVSHPSKFSHPSAKTSSVIAQAQPANDGYLRSGNVDYPLDVFGNAAAMDVFKFLSLTLTEGQTILEGLEQEHQVLKQWISDSSLDFNSLRSTFLLIKPSEQAARTDRLVKQVYFPIEKDTYHLLSILTPSGLITRLKKQIDAMRFSDATKQAKEQRKNNQLDDVGYSDIYDLTVTAYGGTQPQNVSVLNSQNAGRAYLLPSMPPVFEKRKVRLPSRDFFSQCLYRKQFQIQFADLHKQMRLDLDGSGQRVNNIHIRRKIKRIIQDIIQDILYIAFCIRKNDNGWSEAAHYQNLFLAQRIWLDDFYLEQREVNDEWRDEISRQIAKWILHGYENVIANASMLGTGELIEVKKEVDDALQQDKEFF